MLSEFEGLYAPILGSSDSSAPQPALTPQATLARTNKLREHYEDLRKDLLGDLAAIDDRMIRPASQAREFISPVKKTIKKRDDRKVRIILHRGPIGTPFLASRSGTRPSMQPSHANIILIVGFRALPRARRQLCQKDEAIRPGQRSPGQGRE